MSKLPFNAFYRSLNTYIYFVILNKNILKIAFLHEVSGYSWWCIWINR